MIQSRGKRPAGWVLLAALGGPLQAVAAAPKAPPVQPATSFAAVEVHPGDRLAIAAEPYDNKEKASLFQVNYLGHGVLPVRLIVSNLGDRPVSLREARILLETAGGDRLRAAEPADVERRLTLGERQGATLALPVPIPAIHFRPRASDRQVEQDFARFGYGALVVEPHTTQAGFLFFDVSGLDHPLAGARLGVYKLLMADGSELFSFSISLDKYLQSKSSTMN